MKRLSVVLASAVALMLSAVSFTSVAGSGWTEVGIDPLGAGNFAGYDIIKFTAEVPETCGIHYEKRYAELGIDGQWSGDKVELYAFNNVNGIDPVTGLAVPFALEFWEQGMDGKDYAGPLMDTFKIKLTGSGVANMTYQSSDNDVEFLSVVQGDPIFIEAKTSLPAHLLPAGTVQYSGHVRLNCF